MSFKTKLLLVSFFYFIAFDKVHAAIHAAPVVLKGEAIQEITRYPIGAYRLFKTNSKGNAEVIPFQIDEINEWGDYVIDEGAPVNNNTGNYIFDFQDELSFMGNDVGPAIKPKFKNYQSPAILYELKFSLPNTKNIGAVYVGIYFSAAPKLSERKYVTFNPEASEVLTSRYRYKFNPKNHLVVDGISARYKNKQNNVEEKPLMNLSQFYLKADLKYFLTLEADQSSIDSKLEAYKRGPIRSIARVVFFYRFLRINFELGMYTEVSFFANAVKLPAIMYNPVEGSSSFNSGSGFYYGFNLIDNPKELKISTNMPEYQKSKNFLLDFFSKSPGNSQFWLSAHSADKLIYLELTPSQNMIEKENIPHFYTENSTGSSIVKRGAGEPAPLGKSPVNLAVYFDLTKFTKGEQVMEFKLFFENMYSKQRLDEFKSLKNWKFDIKQI